MARSLSGFFLPNGTFTRPERGMSAPSPPPTVRFGATMRQSAVLEIEVEAYPRQEFGNGLRARLELVRTLVEVTASPPRRDISPELMLVSPLDTTEVAFALGRAR